MLNAKRAFEVGVFTGYSSLATALDDERHASGRRAACSRATSTKNGPPRRATIGARRNVDDVIELELAPATRNARRAHRGRRRAGNYDLGFIDADKTGYDAYYERGLQLLRQGGVMLFDNVLWSGRVADPADTTPDTSRSARWRTKAKADARVHAAMTNIGDGVLICVKNDRTHAAAALSFAAVGNGRRCAHTQAPSTALAMARRRHQRSRTHIRDTIVRNDTPIGAGVAGPAYEAWLAQGYSGGAGCAWAVFQIAPATSTRSPRS